MPPGMEVRLSPGNFAFDRDLAPPKEGTAPTQFLAHAYWGQMAGWIKMPLGTEVNLSPGDGVLDGSPLKGTQPPVLGSCPPWPNGWMDEEATWYVSRPRPRPHCVRWGPSSPTKGAEQPHKRGRAAAPLFSPCLLWLQWHHLSYCWALVLSFQEVGHQPSAIFRGVYTI